MTETLWIEKEYFPQSKQPPFFSRGCGKAKNKFDDEHQSTYHDEIGRGTTRPHNKHKPTAGDETANGGGGVGGGGDGDTSSISSGHTTSLTSRVSSFRSILSGIGANNTTTNTNNVPETTETPKKSHTETTNTTLHPSENNNTDSKRYPSPKSSPQKDSVYPPPFGPNTFGISSNENTILPTWRLKDRMKTVGVVLVLALNIGTDPPDANKPNPCAKLQCWIDPTSTSRAKAREQIGEKLESQYAKWQQRAKLRYKRALDPTVEDVRNLCISMRRAAKNERLLLHYNGHGVPRPTMNGEIWVFDRNHTQYIPLPIADLRRWISKPSMVVLDCSGAGALLPHLTSLDYTNTPLHNTTTSGVPEGDIMTEKDMTAAKSGQFNEEEDPEVSYATKAVRDVIVLCPTSASESLPLNPELPADLFTSCLTTPIPIALRWFVHQNPLSFPNLDPENVDLIPGKSTDRKTPLGELNWIFTAITDTIAWNVLPSPLFQRLFRQDLLVASMFRNFLLADRILRALHCTPRSHPALPTTCDHPLWQAWDLAVETCLSQLMRSGYLSDTTTNGKIGRNRSQPEDNDDDEVDSTQSGKTDDVADRRNTNNFNGAMNTGNATKGVRFDKDLKKDQAHQQDVRQPTNFRSTTTNISSPTPTNSTSTSKDDSKGNSYNITAPFFAEQLTAFEIWLEFAATRFEQGGIVLTSWSQKKSDWSNMRYSMDIDPPEQLPVVLQVLLSPQHRVRALVLLRRFLYLGPSAVNLALSVGIFPYVLRLLQSPIDEYKHVLVGVWCKILEFDRSCQGDLVKDGALSHFIRHLHWSQKNSDANLSDSCTSINGLNIIVESNGSDDSSHQRTMAALILSAICLKYPLGQTECIREDLHGVCSSILQSIEVEDCSEGKKVEKSEKQKIIDAQIPPQFRLWLCICLGMMCKDNAAAQSLLSKTDMYTRLIARLDDHCAEVRAGACFALGCLIGLPNVPNVSNVSKVPNVPNMTNVSSLLNIQLPNIRTAGNETMAERNNTFLPSTTLSTTKGTLTLAPPPNSQIGFPMNPALQPHLPWQSHQSMGLQLQGQGQHQPKVSMSTPLSPVGMPSSSTANSGMYNQLPHPESIFNNNIQHNQGYNHVSGQTSLQTATTTLEERQRLDLDLSVLDKMVKASSDASPIVRYEAVIVLGQIVNKYTSVIVAIADRLSHNLESVDSGDSSTTTPIQKVQNGILKSVSTVSVLPLPAGVDKETEMALETMWKSLRVLHQSDPHIDCMHAATTIVQFVNEHILLLKSSNPNHGIRQEDNGLHQHQKRSVSSTESTDGNNTKSNEAAATAAYQSHLRTMSAQDLGSQHLLPKSISHRANSSIFSDNDPSQSTNYPNLTSTRNGAKDMSSPYNHLYMHMNTAVNNRQDGAGIGANNNNKSNLQIPYSLETETYNGLNDPFQIDYDLPESKFYVWKKSVFERECEENSSVDMSAPIDPLSSTGAVQLHRSRRNKRIENESSYLAKEFASLVPKKQRSRISSEFPDTTFLDDFQDDRMSSAAAAHEAEISSKKEALHMEQSIVLNNQGKKKAHILQFHSYESALVCCDFFNGISIWDINTSSKRKEFKNGNRNGSRITSMRWVNERTNSLLLTACDDGSVRLWDNIIEGNGSISSDAPALSTAFCAQPEKCGKSGLVIDWQQLHGRLITSGGTKFIKCWDFDSEKCSSVIDTNIDAYVTTLTTAWNCRPITGECNQNAGYSGLGPDIIVAGHSNGAIKVHDIRSSQSGRNLESPATKSNRLRRPKHYHEHSHWIVNTSYSAFSDYQIVSGCVGGDIKFWDLRMSSSVRTIDIQRSHMTCITCHPTIPLLATGSHAQFIKLFTPDGDILQVLRHHEKLLGQRIGAVSCLAFHPWKPMLAAGTTDEIISIYTTNKV